MHRTLVPFLLCVFFLVALAASGATEDAAGLPTVDEIREQVESLGPEYS